MTTTDKNSLDDRLEPGIRSWELSQAVSLKRIADSLDRLTTAAPALMSVLDINGPTAAAAAVKAATAPKTDDNDWIDWPGGECPVPDGTLVDVEFRNGSRQMKEIATGTDNSAIRSDATSAFWRHDNLPCDIVKYRVSK